MKPTRFDNIFSKDGNRGLCTINFTPGLTFFDESLRTQNQGGKVVEYRMWDPKRSKLGAGVMKGLSQIGIRSGSVVLYLGAAHGYTPSFVSDIIGSEGMAFCLDFAPRVVKDLVYVCEQRTNMIPLLGDACQPKTYKHKIAEVDVVFQDIAQHNQTKIFLDNCEMYLKKGGFGLLCLKARSVDVTKKPQVIFSQVKEELEKHLVVVDYRNLDPYEKDHAIFVCKKR